jgi:hypothetical protein
MALLANLGSPANSVLSLRYAFWNTQFQWVRPSMRTEVSSEQTIRERRSRAS